MVQYSGTDIFKLMDTHGFPLEIINMMLREREGFFNAEEFIDAARSAGWKDERIYRTLISATPLQGEEMEKLKQKLESKLDRHGK